jgi:hypothetical protein
VLAPLAAVLHLLDGLAFGGSCIELHAVPTRKTVAASPASVE